MHQDAGTFSVYIVSMVITGATIFYVASLIGCMEDLPGSLEYKIGFAPFVMEFVVHSMDMRNSFEQNIVLCPF